MHDYSGRVAARRPQPCLFQGVASTSTYAPGCSRKSHWLEIIDGAFEGVRSEVRGSYRWAHELGAGRGVGRVGRKDTRPKQRGKRDVCTMKSIGRKEARII